MNPAVILALISDLYAQVESLSRAVEERDKRIAELTDDPGAAG